METNVTALMPVKNGGVFLQRSLLQLQLSCNETDEILVIDDFSNDNTAQIVKDASKTDERIRLLSNSNPGIVGALNLGLSEASNKWIARVDVDDIYEVSRIDEQRVRINSNVIGIFSDYDFFSENFPYLGTIPSAIDSDAVAVSLISSQRTAHPSILFNKESVLDVGGYQQEDFPAEDFSLWLRMSRVGKLISIPKVLLHYRLSAGSVTGTKREASISKKNALIQSIGINPLNVERISAKLEQIFEAYKSEIFSNEREILLVRDLIMILRTNSLSEKSRKKIRSQLVACGAKNLTSISKMKSIIMLQKEKKLRDKARNLI
jgi:glycosyltransferase involved in cell wall biosynthesis